MIRFTIMRLLQAIPVLFTVITGNLLFNPPGTRRSFRCRKARDPGG